MDIIVQKFGGTSVATQSLRQKVARKVILTKKKGIQPVVVVSAMGRKGDPYATDTLIDFIESIYLEQDSREKDMIMSVGEIISAVIMSSTLKDMGYKSVALTGNQAGIYTDERYGDAEVTKVDENNILKWLDKGYIPVVAGFQGASINGDLTTLGRGGSDTTAAILGEALKAKMVEIYTDVEGVMTADPRLVANARVIDKMSYDEVYQMAEDGAKVVHPRAVSIAKRGNILLKIKSTLTDAPGTIIQQQENYTNKYSKNIIESKILTAIAHKNNVVQVNVYYEDCMQANELLMNKLSENEISIDLINFFVDKKVFTIEEKNRQILEKILDENGFNYNMIPDCSKITVVGHKMRGIPGVMAKIVNTLSRHNIKILQTSDSHNTISCLVKNEDTQKAVSALHEAFGLFK